PVHPIQVAMTVQGQNRKAADLEQTSAMLVSGHSFGNTQTMTIDPLLPFKANVAKPALWSALARKQVLDQSGGSEHEDDNDKEPEQAHAPHHAAAHHLIHHRAILIPQPASPGALMHAVKQATRRGTILQLAGYRSAANKQVLRLTAVLLH